MCPATGTMWGPRFLASVEAEFFALRRRAADLTAAFRAAARLAGGDDGPDILVQAGEVLSAAVIRYPNTLAYHNAHHFAEAVLAMGWLCAIARRAGWLDPRAALLGVIAMVGHDFQHDGAPPNGGLMEQRSADASIEALAPVGLASAEQQVLRAVILGTDPDQVRENAARAASVVEIGPASVLRPDRGIALLRALANEADVFASFLPDLGPRQSQMLAREWSAGGHIRPGAASFAHRLAFLRLYDQLTPMSRQLGVADLRARQFQAFTCGGGLLEIGGTPEDGAAALDALPPDDARQRFTECLRLPAS